MTTTFLPQALITSRAALLIPLVFLAAVSLNLALVPSAHAGTFSVSPVRIYMTPKDRAIAVTINNDGTEPVALQADLYLWQQKADGTDDLQPTDDMVMAPPILKIPPKSKQVLRLARVVPPDASRQLTYRLIVREIPEATQPKEAGISIPIALAFSMPVFITPPVAQRDMACSLLRGQDPEGPTLAVRCANTGTAYSQVRSAVLERNEQALARVDGGVYILPGAAKNMVLGSAEKPAAVTPPAATASSPFAPTAPAPVAAPRWSPVGLAAGPADLKVSFDDGKTQSFKVQVP